LGSIAQDGPEFAKTAVNGTAVGFDDDITGKKTQVGKFGPRSQVDLSAQDGVSKIGKMAGFGIV